MLKSMYKSFGDMSPDIRDTHWGTADGFIFLMHNGELGVQIADCFGDTELADFIVTAHNEMLDAG